MIKGWKGPYGSWPFDTATWRGPADASGRTPRGHGVFVFDSLGIVHEGACDDGGRRQGEWVGKLADGRLHSFQCVDDAVRDYEARAAPRPGHPPS